MPVVAEWEDETYVQQLDGNLTITVTAPTKVDNVIIVNYMGGKPNSPSNGTMCYVSADKLFYYYNGSKGWETVSPKTRDEDGVIYYSIEYSGFYQWNATGESLDAISYVSGDRAFRGTFWHLKSTTTAPSSPSLWDSYFNSSSQKIYTYNGYSWVDMGTPMTSQLNSGYPWYVIDETIANPDGSETVYNPIVWYYPATSKMEYRYVTGNVLIRDSAGVQTYVTLNMYSLNGKSLTLSTDMLYSYLGDSDNFRLLVRYNDYSGRTSGSDYLPDVGSRSEAISTPKCYGRGGDSINTALSQTATIPTYPTVSSTFTFKELCTPTSSATASILVPLSVYNDTATLEYLKYGVVWNISKSGGEGPSYGSMTFANAVSAGYVVVNGNDGTSSNNYFNKSKVDITFRYSGDYTIQAITYYRDTSSTIHSHTDSITVKVYNNSSPVIQISSQTPNPTTYPPSYTVVLHDNSSTASAYQIPQQTITIDAGDSADAESWTLENTGSAVTSIPDKTHIYNGYGPYRPSLTIVDKNGNTSVGYCQFAPNKTARIYTPTGWSSAARLGYNGSYYYGTAGSTITVTTNAHAPILLTAESGVAGDPLPTVTWAYTSSNPSYYNGSVEGAYAELSLLASGTYTVTCTITNGTTTLATYTWSVSVLAEEVSTDADKAMPDFALIVLNGTSPIDYCKVHSCPQYTSKWQDSDTVQFELPINYQYASYLQEGQYFVFGYQGAKLFVVTYRQQARDTITITGTAVFPERVAITGTRSSANDGYDVQECSAEALIRYFVHSALTDPYSTAQPRSANFAIHGTCQDYPTGGDAVTYSARYETTQDIVNEICETSGIGYSVGIRNVSDGSIDKCQLWIKQGTDRTYTSGGSNAVIFSEELKNMRISSDQSALSPNVAIGAGQGTGNYREYTYYNVSGATPTDTGFNRREVFVDAGDAADSAEVKRMSVLELKQNKQLSIKIQVLPSCQWVFGTGYNVGDTVTLVHPQRGQLDLQIFSVEHVRRQTGDELYLNLGSRSLTAPTLISRVALANTYSRK